MPDRVAGVGNDRQLSSPDMATAMIGGVVVDRDSQTIDRDHSRAGVDRFPIPPGTFPDLSVGTGSRHGDLAREPMPTLPV